MKQRTVPRILGFAMLLFVAIAVALPAAVMAEPKAGDVIDKTNIEQYKDYLPPFMVQMVSDGGFGIADPITLHVKEYGENLEPPSFRRIAQKNAGKTTLNADGTMIGYVSGLPFPDAKEPDRAQKIMWNYTYRWRGDDFSYPGGYVNATKRKGGKIAYTKAEIKQLKFSYRTAVDPKPAINNPRNLLFAQLFISMTPPSKDIQNLMWRYDDPFKDDEMWAYIPTLRRTLRLVSSERSNPVRGSAYTWDDFYGFDGQPMKYDFKLVDEKPMLVIVNQNTMAVPGSTYEKGYDRPVMDGPEDPFEIRKVYIIEAKNKDTSNPESKKVLYILEDTHNCVYSEIFDKSGEFWKGLTLNFAKLPTETGETGPWATGSSMIDFKTQFWTYALLAKVRLDGGMEPGMFSPGALGTF